MPKWKIQAVEPNTCDPPGCRYYELWDSLSPPPATPVVICGVGRVCPAHAVATSAAKGKIKWSDGNWKDFKSYIQYQRNWFKWTVHQEWLARKPVDEFGDPQQMPEQIAGFKIEPVTPGSTTPPLQTEQDDLDQVYTWNKEHNNRASQTLAIILSEGVFSDSEKELITTRFEGAGDTRIFYINSGGVLTAQQLIDSQAAVDIQFGLNKVVVEA